MQGRSGRSPRWAAGLGAAVVLLAGCTGSVAEEQPEGPPASSTPPPSPSPAQVRGSGSQDTHPIESATQRFEVPAEALPYPYTTPVPPDERTPIDGTYLRILTLEEMDGILPFRCLRCPPYFPNAGVSTLIFHRGDYWLNHQLSGFRALGMYTVDGDRVTFFNDPWCPQDRGTYRWEVDDGVLTFEAVSGTCSYEQARERDLTKKPWDRIRPCIYLIEHLWPGPVAC